MPTSHQYGAAQSDAKSWKTRLSGYRKSDFRRSVYELLITAVPFALAWGRCS